MSDSQRLEVSTRVPARRQLHQLFRDQDARCGNVEEWDPRQLMSAEEVAAVRAAVDRYRAAKSAVEEQGNAGLAELISRIFSAKAGRR